MKFKIDGKTHTIPTSWEEVPFKTYLELIDDKSDYINLLSLFIGIPPDELRGAKIQGLPAVISCLQFLKKEPAIDENPTHLGFFKLPTNVEVETMEQFELVRMKIAEVHDKDLKTQNRALAYYAAVYCAEHPISEKRIAELEQKFMDLPCVEVMAAGSFFQARCIGMVSGLKTNYLRRNILLRKRRPGLSRLMRRLAFWLHWTRSRDTLDKMTT